MIGLAKLSAAMLGTSTMANGFAVTPTGPASLQVVCAPGEIYSLTSIDALAFSTLPADTTHSIMKQGILLDGVTLSCPAPGTTGQSINYLVQVTYQDSDSTPVLLPYYNSANPALPYSGMGNNGLTQNTNRKGVAVVAVKAGASAVTGSQVTPAPDSGYVGLYVVTVAFGQTTITAGSISQYSGAPLLPVGLVQAIQTGKMTGATDIGTANAYAANFSPAITALNDMMTLCIKAANANTGASTFTPAPGVISAAPIVGSANSALQGGEIIATGDVWLQWNTSVGGGSWVILDSTGGAVQVANATKGQHAIPLAQAQALFSPIVGSMRNGKMSVTTASASATFTADELFVETALGGLGYKLSSFSKNINLATTGAGGMDTGLAPVSGYVSLYAIYNPSTSTSALLAVDTTAIAAPSIYGGANMPSGYSASALVSTWRTNASRQLIVGSQRDRDWSGASVTVLNITPNTSTPTSLSVTAGVPLNAVSCRGWVGITSGAGSNNAFTIQQDAAGSGYQYVSQGPGSGLSGVFSLDFLTNATLFYTCTVTVASGNFQIGISSYRI